jgi:hypothetical protein
MMRSTTPDKAENERTANKEYGRREWIYLVIKSNYIGKEDIHVYFTSAKKKYPDKVVSVCVCVSREHRKKNQPETIFSHASRDLEGNKKIMRKTTEA